MVVAEMGRTRRQLHSPSCLTTKNARPVHVSSSSSFLISFPALPTTAAGDCKAEGVVRDGIGGHEGEGGY